MDTDRILTVLVDGVGNWATYMARPDSTRISVSLPTGGVALFDVTGERHTVERLGGGYVYAPIFRQADSGTPPLRRQRIIYSRQSRMDKKCHS